MADTLSLMERPASLLDGSLPRAVHRAAQKLADRLNVPVHVFHILSGARKGEYDAVESTDTAWLARYRARVSAQEVIVIEPSHAVPAPLHVMRAAQRLADRKGEALHLFRADGDYDGVFASDREWLKQYRAEHTEVAVVEPTRKKPDHPPVPSPASTRPKKTPPTTKAKKERIPKQRPSASARHTPTVAPREEPMPVETAPVEEIATVTPPAVIAPKKRAPKGASPKRPAPTPTVETSAPASAEEDELAAAEASMDKIAKLLEAALSK